MKAYALNVILNKPDASRSKLCEQERQSWLELDRKSELINNVTTSLKQTDVHTKWTERVSIYPYIL